MQEEIISTCKHINVLTGLKSDIFAFIHNWTIIRSSNRTILQSNNFNSMKILLTGGGSGGHIIPLLAVVAEIEKLAKEKNIRKLEFMLISPDENFSSSLFERGIKVKKIDP